MRVPRPKKQPTERATRGTVARKRLAITLFSDDTVPLAPSGTSDRSARAGQFVIDCRAEACTIVAVGRHKSDIAKSPGGSAAGINTRSWRVISHGDAGAVGGPSIGSIKS